MSQKYFADFTPTDETANKVVVVKKAKWFRQFIIRVDNFQSLQQKAICLLQIKGWLVHTSRKLISLLWSLSAVKQACSKTQANWPKGKQNTTCKTNVHLPNNCLVKLSVCLCRVQSVWINVHELNVNVSRETCQQCNVYRSLKLNVSCTCLLVFVYACYWSTTHVLHPVFSLGEKP